MSPRRSPILALLALGACVPDSANKPDTERYVDGNAGRDVDAAVRAAQEAEAASTRKERGAGELFIEQLAVTPAKPTLQDSIVATATLPAGASPYTEVDYTWFVNDRELVGVRRERLEAGQGYYRKGDRVRVVARATDEKGRTAEAQSKPILVVNSKPSIITDARNARGLNGVRLEAEDPDGDPLGWSVASGPPGVTIDDRGFIRVETRRNSAAYTGEVVFAATDPDGARAELHVPVDIGAATEGYVEKREVQRVVYAEELSADELAKRSEKEGERVTKMSRQEYEAWMKEQERRAAEKKAQDEQKRK